MLKDYVSVMARCARILCSLECKGLQNGTGFQLSHIHARTELNKNPSVKTGLESCKTRDISKKQKNINVVKEWSTLYWRAPK